MKVNEKKILFSIDNLSCSYGNKGEEVLSINNLQIYEGDFVVILGASGVGKTTLLEVLGLMSNTMNKDAEVKFYPPVNQKNDDLIYGVDFNKLWKKRSFDRISEIRKWHLSFIFQNTQLMPKLNIYENIRCLQIIQEDIVSDEKLDSLVKEFNLKDVDLSKFPHELSGGQKQRVAFLNIASSNYSVLLGDEPTGSLDEYNSKILMRFLHQEVQKKNKTVILVSHNISLAEEYSDQIIIIPNGGDKPYSIFLDEKRNKFSDPSYQNKIGGYEISLTKILSDPSQSFDENRTLISDIGKKIKAKKFFHFLFLKEFNALLNMRNLVLSFLLSLISFGAIAFANYYLEELKEQKSPVVMQILVSIYRDASLDVYNYLEVLKTKEQFSLKSYSGQNSVWIQFKDYEKRFEYEEYIRSFQGRTVDLESDIELMRFLIYDSGIDGKILDDDELGVIVTKDLLNRLNYDSLANFIYVNPIGKDSFPSVTIPIKAIVNTLPGNLDFLCTEHLKNNSLNLKPKISYDKILLYIPIENIDTFTILNLINKRLKKNNVNVDTFYIDTFSNYTHQFGYKIETRFEYGKVSPKEFLELSKLIESINIVDNTKIYTDFQFDTNNNANKKKYDLFVLNFKDFKEIKEFEKDFGEKFNKYKIDSSIISQKYAFQIIDIIANTMIVLLILFCSFSLSFLLSSTLANHLNNIRANIGNYLAFGVKKSELILLYFSINFVYLILLLFFSLLVIYVIKEVNVFQNLEIFKASTLYALIVIIVFSLVTTLYTITRFLRKSPGDLIYNR